jgi:isoleucyl-tRNA synthetase
MTVPAPNSKQTDAKPAGTRPELKSTLLLPRTDFPMKANLPENEPKRLAAWAEMGLYQQIRDVRQGAPKYILHDGPPYANGPIHLGHALNKCLKDFVVKSKTMAGFDSPYVPGWDCHGLPIEIKVDEQLGRKKLEMDPIAVRAACRAYAQKYIDLQRTQFERIGVFGRWQDPYLTMSNQYEATTLASFYQLFDRAFVYRGLKPVYWCWHDRTALAEAEVEYEMHTSPSVYVRYALTSPAETLKPAIIWTTTPWTLPASLAIAFHPKFEYVALENTDGNVYLVAAELAEAVKQACHLEGAREIARIPGAMLEYTTFQHPFLDRSILGVLADYVTADQGTGAVHTAPAHGADDFYTGEKYGLDQTCPVDNAGRILNGLPEYNGLQIFKANPEIIKVLQARDALLGQNDIYHSYPHCWRCHNPVIFRATEQWFISMETPMQRPDGSTVSFRQRALEEIKKVTWDPAWGEERISNMIATRPDWCISRQRIWGVPIALFLCTRCNQPLHAPDTYSKVVNLFHQHGADAWYNGQADAVLPKDAVCATSDCGGHEFRRETDILDVWIDSGTSWAAVLETQPELRFPCDLYTEGGDQHRGWFHSSLLFSVGLRNTAPYRVVATSGWTLDEQGRAFSKSLGNGVDPVDIAKRLGGEIVRLWVASVDFREDVSASENLMQRVADNYRKLRNTFRFLLGNLYDFDPAQHAVAWDQLEPLDQYMLARARELTTKVLGWYEEFAFHRIYHAINEFAIVDLSALYADVLKDRLYTFAPNSPQRRAAQTVLWKITDALARLVAPILSFLADEVWQYIPAANGTREPSVHTALFPHPDDLAPAELKYLLSDWGYLLLLRERVLAALEVMRSKKQIGKSLEASVKITVKVDNGYLFELLSRYHRAENDPLRELFNVSNVELDFDASAFDQARFNTLAGGPASLDLIDAAYMVEVMEAEGTKCTRCWNYRTDVGVDPRWSTVCGRCAGALEEIGFPPLSEEVPA